MKYTLLQLTQDILSSMDADQITSINDTAEAQQVVTCIKTVYDDILSRSGIFVYKTLLTLTASGNNAQPVLMTKPTNITAIDWIKYDRHGLVDPPGTVTFVELKFLPIDTFMIMSHELMTTATNVSSQSITNIDGFTFTQYFRNDVSPNYYTSFDDQTILFDSIDNKVDLTTLQGSKTLAFGSKNTDFVSSDTFVPALQNDQFSLLLNESKALAWTELKQTPNVKAETMAARNWRHTAKSREHIPTAGWQRGSHPFQQLPFFGRR